MTMFLYTEICDSAVTRPYIAGKFDQGSQLPLIVTPYNA